jgi:hypothetical protein
MSAPERCRREPASASGGDEESYAVKSADGVVLRWPRRVAVRAGTLKNWIEENRSGEEETDERTTSKQAFPTPLTAKVLETLRAACAHDGDETISPLASLPLNEMINVLGGAKTSSRRRASVAAAAGRQPGTCAAVRAAANAHQAASNPARR